jgi:hypothetical protein
MIYEIYDIDGEGYSLDLEVDATYYPETEDGAGQTHDGWWEIRQVKIIGLCTMSEPSPAFIRQVEDRLEEIRTTP